MVNTLHRTYQKYINQIQLVRDIIEGDTAVKQQKYLPPLPNQTAEEYQAMIARPAFDNFTNRVLSAYTGLAFAKPPVVDVPTKLEPLMDNMNFAKATHEDMSYSFMREVFITGRVGALVNVRDDRPYTTTYPHESIINWRVKNDILEMVVLREMVEAYVNEYEYDLVEEYLVLALDENGKYYTRRYQVNEDGQEFETQEPTLVTQRGATMDYIPFYVATPNKLDIVPAKPPLFDLSVQNLSLMKLKTELYHSLFYVASPTPYGVGIDDENFTFSLGATEIHTFSNPDAKLSYLEFEGQGLQAITNELSEIKKDMSVNGASFLKDSSQSRESTETVQMRNSADNATLISISTTVSRLMVKCLEEMAKWAGADSENITYQINTDYNLSTADAQLLKAYSEFHQMGIISDYDMYYILQKNEVIDQELTYEDWLEYKENSEVNTMMSLPPKKETPKNDDTSLVATLRDKLGI
jgi:hypothetical protein